MIPAGSPGASAVAHDCPYANAGPRTPAVWLISTGPHGSVSPGDFRQTASMETGATYPPGGR